MNDTVPREPFGRRPLAARSDWRRALGVYVSGRSRSLTLDEKRRLGGGSGEQGDEATSQGGATLLSTAVCGIAVPSVFDFYRGASTWREGLPEPKSRGETTADA
jgi:hypothetical protein